VRPVPVGAQAVVRTPATSANLGPGFDCLGLALDLWDEYRVTVTDRSGVRVTSEGEGAGTLPTDATHLVARSLLAGLAAAGRAAPGLELHCRNTIPHRRGLGSSSAAIVGGLTLARVLVGEDVLDAPRVVALASSLEGHPDNVAAAVLGGATIAWIDDGGTGHAARSPVHPALAVTLLIPQSQTETEAARGLLPAEVPYAAAVFNVGRSALLVHAIGADPSLLFTATADRLHQEYRATAYPASLDAVHRLRAAGLPAVISGAGPTVLAFADADRIPADVRAGFAVRRTSVSDLGAHTPMA
jgi:homoserine kinase